MWRMENDLRCLAPSGEASFDKRPKLERAHSAAEKENHPLQRTGSALRRQYSQQEARCYDELEGLARPLPHLIHPRQKTTYGTEDSGLSIPHVAAPQHPQLPRSSSSDEEAPECISDENDEYRDRGKYGTRNTSTPFSRSMFLPDYVSLSSLHVTKTRH